MKTSEKLKATLNVYVIVLLCALALILGVLLFLNRIGYHQRIQILDAVLLTQDGVRYQENVVEEFITIATDKPSVITTGDFPSPTIIISHNRITPDQNDDSFDEQKFMSMHDEVTSDTIFFYTRINLRDDLPDDFTMSMMGSHPIKDSELYVHYWVPYTTDSLNQSEEQIKKQMWRFYRDLEIEMGE